MSASTKVRVSEIVAEAARSLAAELPADVSWTVLVDDEPTALDGGRCVVALLGAEYRVGAILASPLARSLLVGPPPADSVEEGLEPAFKAAAASINNSLGTNVALGTITESTPPEAMASLGGSLGTARLLDGDTHVASFIFAATTDFDAEREAESPVFDQIPESIAPVVHHPVSMLSDVAMGVTVELGRARMTVGEILGLTIGSVIELDRIAGSPVDVLVNGTLIARGEVVVVDEEFGVRVSEVLGYQPTERNRR